ncbi:DUF1772 domain-containing protein [Arcobacter sp. HD9-500m-PIT-SAG02]|nr:DUF1772 domain-containing protein [Arcobacter sp. HD9-500m-PIT-SAG02]
MQHPIKYTLLENGTLAITTIIFGIMSGFFWTYSFNVNYAMLEVSGEVYAIVQSLFNENVRHFMFFIFFFGGGIFSVVSVVANIKHRKEKSFWLIVVASLCYVLGIILFTKEVNLPLNYYTESWQPTNLPSDWSDIRAKWNEANLLRVYASFTSFILCIFAFVVRASRE